MKFTQLKTLSNNLYRFQCDKDLLSKTLSDIKKEEYTNKDRTNYWTVNTLLNKDPKYKDIHEWFSSCVKAVHNLYKFDCQHISITQCWANKSQKGQQGHMHIHPNSLISGVFYLTDASCPTLFVNDSIWKEPSCIRLNRIDTETNFLVFHNEPSVAGNLILFPSTLRHIQEKHTDTEERYTMAFNTFPSGLCGNETDMMGVTIEIL